MTTDKRTAGGHGADERRPARTADRGAGGSARDTGRRPPPADRAAKRAARPYEDPRRTARRLEVSEDIDPRDLDVELRRELRSLSKDTADRVARHLLAAGAALDEDDSSTALAHAHAARALAGRVAGVREAVGVVAYRAEQWREALSEIRAGSRMSGRVDLLALQADCERALGRPEQALLLAESAAARRLGQAEQVELAIVVAGARRDLGQADAAVLSLQGTALRGSSVQPWTARLWYAYADALLAAGRTDEARNWFVATVGIDDGETDAYDRLADLDE